ncbi:MAG: antitoxin VapB family protein [Candidatus Nanohaloarchaea archaeon]|nr:antitoxin VapB family protein [Candidatus Nanohaloarchaea archaeon]
MSKTISVADDVYELMKSKKGDRSFSEFIRSRIGSGNLRELEGVGFSKDWDEIAEAINAGGKKDVNRIEDRTA